jgi:Eukaryotic porin
MANLENYSDLSKLSDDLFKKNFYFGQDLSVAVYSKWPGFNLKSSLKQDHKSGAKPKRFWQSYFEWKFSSFNLKHQISTRSLTTILEVVPEWYTKSKLKLEIDSNPDEEINSANISAQISDTYHRTKLSLTPDTFFRLSSVVGVNGLETGVDLTYDPFTARLVSYNAAVCVYNNVFRAVLKHISVDKASYKLGTLLGSFYYSGIKDYPAALELSLANNKLSTQVAVQSRLSDTNTLKLKANQYGVIGFSVRSKVNSILTIVTATQFNVLDSSEPLQLGLRLKINQ